MSEHTDGGPAFPAMAGSESIRRAGMTLLAYYAGQALIGHGPILPGEHYPTIADSCVRMARSLVVRLQGDGEPDDLKRDYTGNLVWRRDVQEGDTVRISPAHWLELSQEGQAI